MKPIINLLIILAFFIGSTGSLYSQNAEQQYQKGLMQEEGEGNLEEAINIYNSIVENQNAEQSLQAKALLHVGLCYEKLGKDEATKAYQKLVNNFPSQKNEVAIARERLSKLILILDKVSDTPKVMTSKKIWEENEVDNLGEISPDGKYISYVDWPAGDLANYEIATGKKRRLTSYNYGETWSTGSKTTFVLTSIWSADSRQIIYSTGTGEIRTIGLENSTPRTIRERETKNEWAVQVYDISEDGKTILGTIETMDTTTQIILVSVSDGEKQIIKKLPGIRILGKLKFTSDGAGVVYDYPPDLESPVHDIYCLSLDGKTETPIIKHPAHDFVLDLSPDGKQLLFASSRSGKMGFYYVGLKNGKTLGNPKLIKTCEYSNLTGLGFSDNGVFYCFYQPFVTDVYETEINSETGTIVSHPNEIIGSFMGENSGPDYSSDGKYLAFISRRAPFFTQGNGAPTGNALCIKSLENGTLREIKPDIENFENPKWSPDNRSILMMNWNNKERMREIYKIDLQSEKLSLIFSDKSKRIFDFEWCADGMSIFMVLHYQENDTAKTKLVRYNLETKEEKILYVNHGRKGYFSDLASISCSPDGKWIAFLGLDQKKTMKIIPTSGGEVREIYSLDEKKTIDGKQIWSSKSYANEKIHHCWSADGKYIYLQKFREPRGDGIWNLWQIPVNEGTPVNLGLEMTKIWQISAHPDGRKLVYSNQGSSYKLPQVWKMENFLPSENEETTAKEPEGIKIRQIWQAPYLDDLGTVSLDGKYRSYVDWGLGNVGIHNLLADEKKVLTDEAILGELYQFAQSTVISRDGKKIVYSWAKPYNTNELRLINVNNPETELLYKKTGEELYPTAWLSDNDFVASRSIPEDRTIELVTFNVSEKKIKVKKTFLPGQFYEGLACSPDGKYIAYTYLNKAENGNLDINLLSAEGDMDIPLVTHPSNDKVLGWVPGRKEFLFISDRSGSWDLWAIKLDDTKPLGSAKRIYANIGEVDPMGFSQDGECYFGFSRRNFYSGLAPFNKETGEIDLGTGQSFEGQNFLMSWSPDGQYLAYIEIEDRSKGNPFKLFVQDVKSGEKFQPDNNTLRVSSCKWSPDGKTILVIGREMNKLQEKDYIGGIFMVDIKTGQIDQVLLLSEYEFNRPEDDSAPLSCVEWSPDKRNVYYLFQKDRLVNHNLETGEDKIIYEFSDFSPYILETSPDGKNLLFGLEYPDDKKSSLYTMPVEGGKEKMVCNSQEANRIIWAKYSPDGREIYFVELPEFDKSVLWRVSAEGGTPEKIWSPGKRVEIYDVHPDGNQVAFSIRERTTEVRVIENLSNELEKIYSQNE